MGQLKESKLKKIQHLLDNTTAPKKITSSIKTAYTKLGKRFHLKDAFGASKLIDITEDVKDSSPEEEKESKPELIATPKGPSGCNHHLGYLAERDSKVPIPDECMTCIDLIECLNKVVKK
jgi:hypothetical protein